MDYRNNLQVHCIRVFQFSSCTRKQEYYARYASLTLTTNRAVKYCFLLVFRSNNKFQAIQWRNFLPQ